MEKTLPVSRNVKVEANEKGPEIETANNRKPQSLKLKKAVSHKTNPFMPLEDGTDFEEKIGLHEDLVCAVEGPGTEEDYEVLAANLSLSGLSRLSGGIGGKCLALFLSGLRIPHVLFSTLQIPMQLWTNLMAGHAVTA